MLVTIWTSYSVSISNASASFSITSGSTVYTCMKGMFTCTTSLYEIVMGDKGVKNMQSSSTFSYICICRSIHAAQKGK